MPNYRNAIIAVFYSEGGELLACQRSDNGAWQLPQGGIEAGETSEQALRREMMEELGVSSFTVLKSADETTTYIWPEPNDRWQKGQRIHWFLCRLDPDHMPNLSISDGSFSHIEWMEPRVLLNQQPHWKVSSVETGLKLLGVL